MYFICINVYLVCCSATPLCVFFREMTVPKTAHLGYTVLTALPLATATTRHHAHQSMAPASVKKVRHTFIHNNVLSFFLNSYSLITLIEMNSEKTMRDCGFSKPT